MQIDRSTLALAWSAAIYASSASANALVSFFLVPFLTYYLTPAEYGTVEMFVVASAGLTALVIAGGNTMLMKEHFALESREVSVLTSEILGAIVIVAGVVLAALALLWAAGLGAVVGLSGSLLALAVFVAIGNALTMMLVTGYQVSKQPGRYARFMNGRTLVELMLSIALVGGLGLAWQGRVVGIAATSVASIVVVLFLFKSSGVRLALPRRYRSYIIAAAPALVIANLTGWTHDMMDRFIVAGMVDLHATGLYAIAYRFGMVISVLETSFTRAWQPFFFEHIQDATPEADRKIVKTTYAYVAGLVAVTVMYSLISPVLMRLMVSESYEKAAGMVPIVAAGYCVAGIWKLFTGYLIHGGRNRAYAATLAATAVINVVLSVLLVQRFGYVGAAWATLIAFAAGAVLTAWLAHLARPMPWLLRA